MLAQARCVASRSSRSQLLLASRRSDSGQVRIFSTERRFATSTPGSSEISAASTYGNIDEPALISVNTTIRLKNAALGLGLLGFCAGVSTYSMNTVGQAGGDKDDPLSALKQEAAAADENAQREEQLTVSTAELVRKFQAGDFDPDMQELKDLEQELEEAARKRKPWWKFWASS